jgi:tRNA(fMet)-specific endonuclease VapC
MKFMLDTNICIYIIRRKPAEVIHKAKSIDASQVCISAITLSELEYGVQKSANAAKNRFALAEFVTPFEILPFDGEAAACYGEIRAMLERKGSPIGSMDMLIAAHALSHNLTLVTNNEKEFKRIPSLRVTNWA